MGIDRPADGDDQPDSPERPEGSRDRGGRADVPADPSDLPDRATFWAEYKKAVDAEYTAYAIDKGCEKVEKTEREIVLPAMQRIEAEDPDRHLVGLEFHLKEKDRLSEKALHHIRANPDISYDEAFAKVKDAIRYTFQYTVDRYTDGVLADCGRLESSGFEFVGRRNTWEDEQYKGINSWWRVPENGQVFEVQFHTEASFQAKQETHGAYEKLRRPDTPKAERDALDEYQREVSARVPVPPGAADITNYP